VAGGQLGCVFADGFELATDHWPLATKQAPQALARGAVAQLGERLICIQEVAGSIPTSSTKLQTESGQ
jgi:hypothetical protein